MMDSICIQDKIAEKSEDFTESGLTIEVDVTN